MKTSLVRRFLNVYTFLSEKRLPTICLKDLDRLVPKLGFFDPKFACLLRSRVSMLDFFPNLGCSLPNLDFHVVGPDAI